MKKLCLIISVAACVALPGFSQDGFDQIPGLLATDVMKADSLASEMNYAAIEAKDDEMLARSYYWLGLTNYYMGRFYISSEYFRDAMAARGMQANQEFISSCWNNLGINYEYLGRIDDALEAYQRSLDIAKSEGDSVSIAQSWINLGLLEVKQQQLERALSYFEDAEEWFGRIGDTLNVGLAIQNKGVAYKEMSDWTRLMDYSTAAKDVFESIEYAHGVAECLVNMGYAALEIGNLTQSHQYLNEALLLSEENQLMAQKATSLRNLGLLSIKQNKPREAVNFLEDAMTIYEDNGFLEPMNATALDRLKAVAFTGDKQLYDSLLNQFRMWEKEQNSQTSRARYEELKTVYEHDEQLREIQKQQNTLQVRKAQIFYLLIISALSLIALVITWRLFFQGKKLQRNLYVKNTQLAKQLKILERQREKIFASESKKMSKLEALYHQIEHHVIHGKRYTDSSLNLTMLSQELGTNESYVSNAINQFSAKNFNQFINDYRIQVAQEILATDPKHSIKEVCTLCGFNSYSTFNRIFKQKTGLTPTQYQAQAASDES